MIHQAKQIFNISYKSKSDIIPHELVDKVEDLVKSICIINNARENQTPIYEEANKNARFMIESYIRYNLCAKKVIIGERLSKDALNWIVGEIKIRIDRARAHPGESVGSIAA